MSRGAAVTNSGRKAVGAFEIEIENFWVDRVCDIEPGRGRPVYLTTNWLLTFKPGRGAVQVGGSPYDKRVKLIDFRTDCFEALEGR